MAGPTTENLGDENRILYSGVIGASRAGWKVGIDAKEPLPDFIQEYTRDLLTWFNPRQGWQVAEVRLGLFDPASIRRVAAAAAATSETGAEAIKGDGASEEWLPDMMHLIYFLKAASPPLKRGRGLDIKRVISPNFDGKVNYPEYGNTVELWPRKLGTSYRLPEALTELSNTFYVSHASASVDYERPNPRPPFGPTLEAREKGVYPRNLEVMVTLRNLYTQMLQEEADLRTREDRLRAKREEMEGELGIEVTKPAEAQSATAPAKTNGEPAKDAEEDKEDKKDAKKKAKKDDKAQPEETTKLKVEPGVYRFSIQDHLWFRDIDAAMTKIDEPTISLDDIGGLAEVKGSLRLLCAGLQNPDLFTKWGTRPPRGILLYGPPGTGKTMIAKALANEARIPFFSLQFTDVASRWVHNTAENVKAILGQLDKIEGKKIVFIDEFDNMAVSREEFPPTPGGGSSKKANEILNPLLEYMDGFRSTHDTIFVAATNRKDDVDEAMLRPGRFDRHYHIRPPQGSELIDVYRVQIIRAERGASRNLFAPDVDFDTLMRLSRGFSGADIAEIIRRVLENKVAGELQGENQGDVTTDDLVKELTAYERRKKETSIGFHTTGD